MASSTSFTLPPISELFKDPYVDSKTPEETVEQSEGSRCELTFCDARYNAKGDRTFLRSGTKTTFDAPSGPENRNSALVVTKYFDKKGQFEYNETHIHSQHIKKALETIVASNYPGLNLKNGHVGVRHFERMLFFHHKELMDYGRGLKEEEAARHLKLTLDYLYQRLDRDMRVFRENVEDALRSETVEPAIQFDKYWMLFRPGNLVVHKDGDIDMISKVVSTTYKENIWSGENYLECTLMGLDCDGKRFGVVHRFKRIYRQSTIMYFKVRDLKLVPLKYLRLAERQSIIDKARARSRQFIMLCTAVTQCDYSGLATLFVGEPDDNDNIGIEVQKTTRGRIMLDTRHFAMHRPYDVPDLQPSTTACYSFDDAQQGRISGRDLLTANNKVLGFSFRDKAWGYFTIEYIKDIQYNADAFQKLILPVEQKNMIRALVSAHRKGNLDFDDIIKGKGQGMIMLLYGPPGVGKTLTAESVADYVERPLYSITAADISDNLSVTESSLNKVFDLAAHWNAVLLIDEADVFLAQRSVYDSARNAFVAVFLRVLEYYSGVLILTTNRVTTIDHAFRSRIHLAIKYQPLSTITRQDVWRTFINQVQGCDKEACLKSAVLHDLASHSMDGRMIKNAVRTAFALAIDVDEAMGPTHLQLAVKAAIQFEADTQAEADGLNGVIDEQTDDLSASRKRKRLE